MIEIEETEETVTSVHKAIRILKEFTRNKPELGITDLSRRLGMAKSTISRLIQILCDEKVIQKNKKTRKYHLTLSALEIGSVVYREMEVCQAAMPILRKMLNDVGGVIQLVVYDQGEIVYLVKLPEIDDPTVLKAIGKPAPRILKAMGMRAPCHCTASGKLLLAYQEGEEISRVLSSKLTAFTRTTITSPQKLWDEMMTIRQSAYAVSNTEYREGMYSVAVPITDHLNQVVAALSVTRPKVLISPAVVNNLLQEMRICSRLISERL